jgi:organic hydroperoxide reductase OsmC/OhrA
MTTLEGETLLQRYQREEEFDKAFEKRQAEKIEAHAKLHLAQIQIEAEEALRQVNEMKCFVARSIGQQRRYSNNNGGKTK